MSVDPDIDPEERDPEDRVDPVVKALIERNLEEGRSVATAHARQQLDGPYWPIGLCVAWVLGPDPSTAADLYAEHRLGMELLPLDGWSEARTTLLQALAAGRIEALGVGTDESTRVSIPAQEWIDLRIVQRGPYDEVRRADGSIAYRDVRIEAATMRHRWRPETQAMKTVRERKAIDRACLSALIERMRKSPNDPVPKKELKPQFRGVSERAFERLYSQAVQESGCLAWGKGGRRPSKTA